MIMADRDASESFGSFLKEHRPKYGVTLEQLSDGLCSASRLSRMEDGTRTAGKALQDSLLYRLGVSPDTYEHFLYEEDYLRWKKRQQLLYAVSRRDDMEEAERRLGEYRAQYEEGAKTDVVSPVLFLLPSYSQQLCRVLDLAMAAACSTPEDMIFVRNCQKINFHFQERNTSIYMPSRAEFCKFIS